MPAKRSSIPIQCQLTTLFLVVQLLPQIGCADEPEQPESFWAMAETQGNQVIGLWVFPNGQNRKSKLASSLVPGVYIEELDIIWATGHPRKGVDVSLNSLPKYKKLTSLDLSLVPIDDNDLVHVAKCRRLQSLSLDYTNVTRVSTSLGKLSELRFLSLVGVKVSDKDIAAIRAAIPALKVERHEPRRIDPARENRQGRNDSAVLEAIRARARAESPNPP